MPGTFQKGWQQYIKAAEAGVTANAGQNYCAKVESAIDAFTEEMYEMVRQHGDLGVQQCKGFVAETWHAYTFNINAALRNSTHRASVDQSTQLGSVDVSTNFGKMYSMKYIETGAKSAEAQAKNYYENYYEYLKRPRKGEPMTLEEYLRKYGIENDPEELLKSVYSGQYRVIPKDQLTEAIKHLGDLIEKEQAKDGPNRALVYANYRETLKKLTDRISDEEGIESIPLDKETAEVIVALCREGKFTAEDFGIDIASLITRDYILQQALKAGHTAAVMSLVMEVAPKICEAIIHLVKNGEVDPRQLKELGFAAVKGGALGFVRGYVACALTIACQSGKLGKQLMGTQGNVVAAITVLVMDTVKNAWLTVSGKMTAREMSEKTEDAAIVTISALIGGGIGTVLLPQVAVLGYMVGSFVGSVLGSLIAQGKNAVIIGLCVGTGITLFGLVDQDYSLSKEMISSLGLNVVEPNRVELDRNNVQHNLLTKNSPKRNQVHHLDFLTLRRGVIGVRSIGYL